MSALFRRWISTECPEIFTSAKYITQQQAPISVDSSPPTMAASRTFVIVVLLILEIVAIKSMWIQIHHNGYYAAMVDLRDNGPHLLPGSDTPLKKTYIGIEFIDYVLTVLQCFFANVVDGSAPGLSLFAFQFSGTLLAVVMIVWTESLNPTNRSRWIGM